MKTIDELARDADFANLRERDELVAALENLYAAIDSGSWAEVDKCAKRDRALLSRIGGGK